VVGRQFKEAKKGEGRVEDELMLDERKGEEEFQSLFLPRLLDNLPTKMQIYGIRSPVATQREV